MTKRKAQINNIVSKGSEWVIVKMTIEKVFDGSSMRYSVESTSGVRPEFLSEKFKTVLREDWDIDVDEHTALVAIEESVVDLEEERILFE